jgi:hypothetical protein
VLDAGRNIFLKNFLRRNNCIPYIHLTGKKNERSRREAVQLD